MVFGSNGYKAKPTTNSINTPIPGKRKAQGHGKGSTWPRRHCRKTVWFWSRTGVSGSCGCPRLVSPPGDTPLVTRLLPSRQLRTPARISPFLPNS